MHLNSLHVAEVLSDDSNFRKRAMDKLAGPLAHVLLQTPQDFAAAWLAGLCSVASLLSVCSDTTELDCCTWAVFPLLAVYALYSYIIGTTHGQALLHPTPGGHPVCVRSSYCDGITGLCMFVALLCILI